MRYPVAAAAAPVAPRTGRSEGLSKAMAVELGRHDMRVNALARH
jgi:hypothetical protein